MCQSLVERVAQSQQLMAVADPELLVLFEDWLDELEGEVIALAKEQGGLTPENLAAKFGLSRRGAKFLIAKLKSAGKLPSQP
jgi:predicted HTH transcriptional regulator